MSTYITTAAMVIPEVSQESIGNKINESSFHPVLSIYWQKHDVDCCDAEETKLWRNYSHLSSSKSTSTRKVWRQIGFPNLHQGQSCYYLLDCPT
jgi:hypothetical protein